MSPNHCLSIFIQIDQGSKTPPPGWLYGETNGKKGLFPENYVEKITEEEAKAAGKQDAISVSPPDSSSTVKSLAASLSMQFASGSSFGGSAFASQTSSNSNVIVAEVSARKKNYYPLMM